MTDKNYETPSEDGQAGLVIFVGKSAEIVSRQALGKCENLTFLGEVFKMLEW
ncbi:hypothetical protein KJ562_00920 [Patescibacteria group bacterium]|nr:hypothetical protein [Patescibacteria group bacterium]MBU4161994.1 hypothetical protein [Patescibacteria group bacterium]